MLCALCFIRWLKIHCCERAQIHIYIPFTNISFIIGVPLSTLLSQPTSNLSVLLGDPQESLSPNFLLIADGCHIVRSISWELSLSLNRVQTHGTGTELLMSSQFWRTCQASTAVGIASCVLTLFPSGDYISRQVQTWTKQYRAAETSSIPAMERLIQWLPLHLPQQQRTTVVHGDFR